MDLDPLVIGGLQRGEKWALAACYDAFGTKVYGICRLMLRQATDAEDATQEVFLKIQERARQFAGRARFSTWLHRLTVNHCLNRLERDSLRRHQPLEGIDEPRDDQPSPLQQALRTEADRGLERLLQGIPIRQRAVLVLRELEGLSYAEIAEVLEVPEGTVMSRLSRARERLIALSRVRPRERPASPTGLADLLPEVRPTGSS